MLNYSDSDPIVKDIAIYYANKIKNPITREFFGGEKSFANSEEALEAAKGFWKITDLPAQIILPAHQFWVVQMLSFGCINYSIRCMATMIKTDLKSSGKLPKANPTRHIKDIEMASHWLYEITLTGKIVTLIPLKREHTNALLEASSDGELWNLWYTSAPNEKTVDAYLDKAFNDQEAGLALLFAVVDNTTQKIIGSTRYCNADNQNHRVEIGYTWYAKSYQRTGVNTECKYRV